MSRQPDGPPPPPVVQRLRIRYTKTGTLRFTSHRDFARAFERALRRASIPMAYSAGFSPHPKISYAGAAPTGVASLAEYLEIGLAARQDPDHIAKVLDDALPPGLDVVTVVEATDPKGGLAERLEASTWSISLPDVAERDAERAIKTLLELETAPVERATKDGRRTIDARDAIIALRLDVGGESGDGGSRCATMKAVVRHTTPAVRPDDVVSALREHAGLSTPAPARVTRLAQGRVPSQSTDGDRARAFELVDPLAIDIAAASG